MTVLSTGSRDGAHYLGRGTQGKPVETNLVCLATNPDTDGFGQAQSQMSIQKHDVTVSGLDRCHAKEYGTMMNLPTVPCITPWRIVQRTTMALGRLWGRMESEQISSLV
jgi:hypothetical protein